MLPRPVACDGDDCDYDDTGQWRHMPGCMSRTTVPEPDDPHLAAYLDGYGPRTPRTTRRAAA
jgi:hypothetical protein